MGQSLFLRTPAIRQSLIASPRQKQVYPAKPDILWPNSIELQNLFNHILLPYKLFYIYKL